MGDVHIHDHVLGLQERRVHHARARDLVPFLGQDGQKGAARVEFVINDEDYAAARRNRIVPPNRLTRMSGIGILDLEALDAQRFDGTLHARTSSSAIGSNRFGNEALADVSNVDKDGKIRDANNRMRVSSVANRLWHTDASFVDPPGRYSMLSARVVPPVRADTEFADMRAAYDALDEETRASIEGLRVYHSIVYSRHVLGFDFNEDGIPDDLIFESPSPSKPSQTTTSPFSQRSPSSNLATSSLSPQKRSRAPQWSATTLDF